MAHMDKVKPDFLGRGQYPNFVRPSPKDRARQATDNKESYSVKGTGKHVEKMAVSHRYMPYNSSAPTKTPVDGSKSSVDVWHDPEKSCAKTFHKTNIKGRYFRNPPAGVVLSPEVSIDQDSVASD